MQRSMKWWLLLLCACTEHGETPPHSCDPAFQPLAGGNQGHVYRELVLQGDFSGHVTQCVGIGGYLAIPDDQAELDAIETAVDSASLWVGIDDRDNEGVFVDSKGAPYTALPVIDNTGAGDCVVTLVNGTAMLSAVDCENALAAMCECEP